MSGRYGLALPLLLSAALHVLFIGAGELISRGSGEDGDLQPFQAEYRVPRESAGGPDSREERGEGDAEEKGISISLDTEDPTYRPYFQHLRREIARQWARPLTQPDDPEKGSLLVEITLDSSGELRAVSVSRSSGVKSFDFAAMEAVKKAAPFEPFPAEIGQKELLIRALFVYD